MQVVAPDEPNCPAGHAVHEETPIELLKDPAEQTVQVVAPVEP